MRRQGRFGCGASGPENRMSGSGERIVVRGRDTVTKRETAERRLSEVLPGVIRPYTQTELKSVLSTLKDIGKSEPAVAALLAGKVR